MDTEEVSIDMELTKAEALKLVPLSERQRADWCLSVRLDARIKDRPDVVYQDGLCTWLNLSRAQAKELIADMLSDGLEAKGARIRIRKSQFRAGSKITYWICQ